MTNESQQISLDLIDDPVLAMRSDIDDESIEELAHSIKQYGLINPITVRRVGGRYEVVAGHRRLAATKRIGNVFISALVRDLDDEATLGVRAVENLQRRDISPVDEALYIGHLFSDLHYTRERIAHLTERSLGWVDSRLSLLEYPDYMLSEISAGRIGLGVAKWLMRIEDEATRLNWLEPAARDGINEATAERWFNQWKLSVLPVVATPENVEAASGGQVPPEAAIQCAKCLGAALIRDMLTVWIHKECPDE